MKKLTKIIVVAIVAALGVASLTACNGSKFDENSNISVVTREDGSGTKSAFMEIVGLKGKADVSGVIIGTGTAGVLAEVKGNPQAIAYESLGYVTDEVKMLTVDGVAATVENIKNGTYAIARPLNVLYKADTITSGANKAFYEYLQSSEAQAIISDNGYVSTKDGATAYNTANAAALTGEIDISGSTSLQPLMIKLADAFESIHANVTVTVSGGGSGTGYTNAENGTSDFGMISAEFDSTKAASCTYYEVAKDGIAIIVNSKNTLNNITMAELKNIYNCEQEAATKITTWAGIAK